MKKPTVIFVGGGGEGARGVAVMDEDHVDSITITDGGYGYTSPPSVFVIDNDTVFEETEFGQYVQEQIDAYASPELGDWEVEFAVQSRPRQGTFSRSTRVLPAGESHGARFVPFFKGDGYVEWAQWVVGDKFGYRNLAGSITITPDADNPTAGYSAFVVPWSSVISSLAVKSSS